MRRSFYLFLFILLLSLPGFSQSSTQTITTKEGNQLQVGLKHDKDTIMSNEPTFITFEISNPSDKLLCKSLGDTPANYQIKVDRNNDSTVVQPKIKMSSKTNSGCYDKQKIGSQMVTKLFLLAPATFAEPGNYTITVKKEILIPDNLTKVNTSYLAEVSTNIRIIPADDERLSELIDSLGKRILNGDYSIFDNTPNLFSIIEDKRTIKYHIQALEKFGKYIDEGKFSDETYIMGVSARSLGKYNEDSALEALTKVMTSLNDDVRFSVAFALLYSPHPKALGLLLEMRTDKFWNVRRLVVTGLGKIETNESTSLHREMLKDEDKKVRTAAQKYLDQRGQK